MTTIKRTKIIKKMTFNLQIIIIRMTYMISKMKNMKINMKVIKIKMKRNRILSIKDYTWIKEKQINKY